MSDDRDWPWPEHDPDELPEHPDEIRDDGEESDFAKLLAEYQSSANSPRARRLHKPTKPKEKVNR